MVVFVEDVEHAWGLEARGKGLGILTVRQLQWCTQLNVHDSARKAMTPLQFPVPSPQSSRLILASGSPRRRELLTEAGYNFDVIPPTEDVECGVCSESGPAGLVAELAYRKAAAVRQQLLANPRSESRSPNVAENPKSTIILAADTVAECDGFILGKPRDENDARKMLQQLSGREHRVLSGVCLWDLDKKDPIVRVAVTTLRMDALTDQQLDEYVSSGGWEGKAGAFGYQDRLGWVHITDGSESNVVGLPMELLAEMVSEIGPQLPG
jgi:nucleoside triphosphate pyrophosphatase